MPSQAPAGAFMATFKQLIASAAAELEQADIFCGHGYESSHDEAVALVLAAAELPIDMDVVRFETERCLKLLSKDTFELQRRSGHRAKQAAANCNNQRDAADLERLPPVEVMRAAAQQAMSDIHVLHQ